MTKVKYFTRSIKSVIADINDLFVDFTDSVFYKEAVSPEDKLAELENFLVVLKSRMNKCEDQSDMDKFVRIAEKINTVQAKINELQKVIEANKNANPATEEEDMVQTDSVSTQQKTENISADEIARNAIAKLMDDYNQSLTLDKETQE